MIKRLFAVSAIGGLVLLGVSSVSGVPQVEEPVREIKNCVNGDSLPEGKCVRAEDFDDPVKLREAIEAATGRDISVDEKFEFIEGDLGR